MDKVLKALLKGALKSVAPVVGSLAVQVAEAAGEGFLEARERAQAADITGRLVRRMRDNASVWLQREGLSENDIEALTATVQDLGGQAGVFVQRWSDAAFDPEAAADACLDRSASLLRGLSEAHQRLCRMLLVSMFRGLVDERKALEATEVSFRRNVLQGLDRLSERLAQLPAAERQDVGLAVAAAAFGLPTIAWRPELSPPGALLRADLDDPVPFHGRARELEDLLAWSESGPRIGVRVYTGPGGMGKTRLMRHAVERLRQRGWQSGFLDSRVTEEAGELWAAVAASPDATFHIVDYAETRRPVIARLLVALLAGGPVARRVVLLARAADGWWEHLRGQGDGVGDLLQGPASRAIRLGPLASSLAERQASFEQASAHFAAKLGRSRPPIIPDDLDGQIYGRTLLLHMRALADAEGVVSSGDQGLLDYVLARERRFWAEVASATGLSPHLQRGLGRAMAAITLAGGCADRQAAIGLIRRLRFFADQPIAVCEAIAHLLHDVYPGDRWIEPMLPDLLGEHLVQVELDDDPDQLLGAVLDTSPP
jgi:hypothetical protein